MTAAAGEGCRARTRGRRICPGPDGRPARCVRLQRGAPGSQPPDASPKGTARHLNRGTEQATAGDLIPIGRGQPGHSWPPSCSALSARHPDVTPRPTSGCAPPDGQALAGTLALSPIRAQAAPAGFTPVLYGRLSCGSRETAKPAPEFHSPSPPAAVNDRPRICSARLPGFSRAGNQDERGNRLPAAPPGVMVVRTAENIPAITGITGPGIPEKESRHGPQEKEHRAGERAAQRPAHAGGPAARPIRRPPADGPAAAVWAALTASPGTTAAQIATAAGTSPIAAGRELAALEASGLATRTPGARTGRTTAPATWQPAPQPESPAPAAPAAAEEAPQASPAADTAAASPAPAAGDGDLPAPSGPDEAVGSAPEAGTAGSAPGGGGSAGETAPVPADSDTPGEAAGTGAPDAGTPADTVPPDSPGAGETAAPAPAGSEPQHAAAGEAAALLRELASAASGAGEALDGGDTTAALAVMDAICAGAAQSRRLVKAAAAGRKPRGTGTPGRPGQLRDLVEAHLAAHPGTDFTPHQIGRVLDRSSGAVANALDRLTALGRAHLTSEKPRRYQATAPVPAPAAT